MEVLVLVDFEGQLEDELTIAAGDIISKVQPGPEEGWLQGELGGQVGLFPQQFVQEIPANLRADGSQRCPRSLRSAPAVKKLRWCCATFPYVPAKEDELQLSPGELVQVLEEIEDGWWLGTKSGLVGAFPSNFVQELSGLPPEATFSQLKGGAGKQQPQMTSETFLLHKPAKPEDAAQKPRPSPETSPQAAPASISVPEAPRYCRVLFDYEPAHADELRLRRGSLVRLLSTVTADEGWWDGESHGERGLFPDNFVLLLTRMEPEAQSRVPARSKDRRNAAFPSRGPAGEEPLQGSKAEERQPPGNQQGPKEQKGMAVPKLNPAPIKKAAPPPPPPPLPPPPLGPAKAKPCPPHKPDSAPVSCTTPPSGRERGPETEMEAFDPVLVPSSMLSHPTASRPKVPGKRPPTQLMASPPGSRELTSPASSPEKAGSPRLAKEPSVPAGRTQEPEELLAALEGFKAELQALRTGMEGMQAQHQKDMAELMRAMKEGWSRQAALQAELDHLKRLLPTCQSSTLACQKLPPSTGAAPGAPSATE